MPTIRVLLCSFEDEPLQLPTFTRDAAKSDHDLLEDLFRLLNHVEVGDGERMPTGGKHRSLSAGDIVFLDDVPWGCASCGWVKLTAEQVEAYKAIPQSRDRLLAYRKWGRSE